MKLFDSLRRSPEQKIDDAFLLSLPRNDRVEVLGNVAYASASAQVHSANIVVGHVTDPDTGMSTDVNYGDWVQAIEDADRMASLGVHIGYMIGDQALSELSPEEVILVQLPKCHRGII